MLYRCNFKRALTEGGLDACSLKKISSTTPPHVFFPTSFTSFLSSHDHWKVKEKYYYTICLSWWWLRNEILCKLLWTASKGNYFKSALTDVNQSLLLWGNKTWIKGKRLDLWNNYFIGSWTLFRIDPNPATSLSRVHSSNIRCLKVENAVAGV